jgi:hypothetical protein
LTAQTTGWNLLTRFAIRVLTMVANSASCERAFGNMGVTHTKWRSRLSAENVRKTTVVRMDLKRGHAAAGLLCHPAKRKIGLVDETSAYPAASESETGNEGISAHSGGTKSAAATGSSTLRECMFLWMCGIEKGMLRH